jgi:AP endonuclease 2
MSAEDARSAWSNTFAKMAPPKCRGHNEPCKIRTVKQKDNPNFGRVFFCCSRPAGPRTNRECDCGFFKWRDDRKI